MLRILFFFGLLFGLFGIYISQYISQYREAYLLWVQRIVYDVKDNENNSECNNCDKKLCSKIESYSRELCTLARTLCLLFFGTCATYTVFIIASYSLYIRPILKALYHASFNNSSFSTEFLGKTNDFYIGLLTTCVATLLLALLPKILAYSNVDIKDIHNTSAIDEKLFYLWYKLKCFDIKNESYRQNLKPYQLYEMFAEKYISQAEIDGEKIEIPEDIKKVMLNKKILKNKYYENP